MHRPSAPNWTSSRALSTPLFRSGPRLRQPQQPPTVDRSDRVSSWIYISGIAPAPPRTESK
eukprot:scaffold29077_cov20-Prasinocladus_malaysianus.AAC.1